MSIASDYYRAITNLRPENHIRLQTVEWLTGEEERGTGRTHLLALAYLRHALVNPGKKIWVWDHVVNRSSLLRDVIHSMAPGRELTSATPNGPSGVAYISCNEPNFLARTSKDPRSRARADFMASMTPEKSIIQDIQEVVRAAIHMNVDPAAILVAVKEAIVDTVMGA